MKRLTHIVILILCLSMMAWQVQAQAQENYTISGIIKDAKSGETMPFVHIVLTSTGKGTSTNVNGFFSLFKVPSLQDTLLISYLGYGVQEYVLQPEDTGHMVQIMLEPAAVQLKTIEIVSKKEQTIEVSKDVSQVTINPAQLATLPNLGEVDIFRGIQLLPGVSGSNETSSGLYVRGGTPDQNLVLLDGITVYHVDHFYGLFSAFNANAIKHVQVYKGGFGAAYGGRISSVVDMTAKHGNRNQPSVSAGVNLLSSNIVLETPITKKASLLLAGRRSYTDFIQSPIYDKLFKNVTETDESQGLGFGISSLTQIDPVFHFYDYNGKLTVYPTEKDVLSLSAYGGKDHLDNSSTQDFGAFGESNSKLETTDLTNWGNQGFSARWFRQWGPRFYSNLLGAYSNYFSDFTMISDFTFDTLQFSLSTIQDNDVREYAGRWDNVFDINDQHQLKFGSWLTYNDISYLNILDDTLTLQDRNDKGMQLAGYAHHTYKPVKALSLSGGLRTTYFDVTGKMYLEPRASFQFNVTDQFRLKGAWGLYNQFINRVILEDIFNGSRDFWLLSDGNTLPVMSSIHYVAGGAYEKRTWLVDVEAWQKNMQGLLEYSLRFGTLEEQADQLETLFFKGTGVARGVDFLLQKKTGKFTGWVAYTLSQVEHHFSGLNHGKPFPALHDQRHELKLIGSFKVWYLNFSSTFVYATGKPFTEPIGRYTITLLDGHQTQFIHVGDKNASRLPAYHRLDFAISYEQEYRKKAKLQTGISFFNVYNRRNIKYKRYQLLEFDIETFQPIEPELIVTDVTLLGFLPNLFVNVKF